MEGQGGRKLAREGENWGRDGVQWKVGEGAQQKLEPGKRERNCQCRGGLQTSAPPKRREKNARLQRRDSGGEHRAAYVKGGKAHPAEEATCHDCVGNLVRVRGNNTEKETQDQKQTTKRGGRKRRKKCGASLSFGEGDETKWYYEIG